MGVLMQGEEALRASGVPYTVVRPGGLTGDPAGQARLVAAQGRPGQRARGASRRRGSVRGGAHRHVRVFAWGCCAGGWLPWLTHR